MADYDESECCPLCMEELDLTDKTFKACPCGYQVCLWCWHQIKNEYNGLCPACRQPYAELSKQKSPLDREEVVRRSKQRKHKEKTDRRSSAQAKSTVVNRKSLQNVRVMQRNLVYVIGLPVHFAEDELLRSYECFGQYGKIVKAVVNKAHLNADRANATASAYITFAHKEDALCCIVAIDGFILDGSLLRASFGTTKYCNFFLRNMQCNNPECLYLHELGDEDDSFTKEEMQSALHSGKAAFRELSMTSGQSQEKEGTRFPPPCRPAAATSASSPALLRSQSEGPASEARRHAQSAAAISKLRQKSRNRTDSPSPDRSTSIEAQELTRGHSYSNIVASTSAGTIPRSELHVDTSEDHSETVIGPLEALKLATGSSTAQPAWAQPFPLPSVALNENEATGMSTTGLYSPFGFEFTGGLASDVLSPPVSSETWKSSTDCTFDSFATAPATSFASIDAIFSQQHDSDALGTPVLSNLLTTPKDATTSRFSFANAIETDGQHSNVQYELLDGTTVNNGKAFPSVESHAVPPSNPMSYPVHSNSTTDSSGLTFLQQMLPNVNISFGGDYSTGLSARNGTDRSRRLFERSQSTSGRLRSPEEWNNGLHVDSAPVLSPFYDPALVPNGFSSFGLNSSHLMTSNTNDSERLRRHSDFSEACHRTGSLVNNN